MTTKEYKVRILAEFMTLTPDEDKALLQKVINEIWSFKIVIIPSYAGITTCLTSELNSV